MDYCTAPLETWRKIPAIFRPFFPFCIRTIRNLCPIYSGTKSDQAEAGRLRRHFFMQTVHIIGTLTARMPVRDAQGKVLRFVGSSSDIQELR